MDENKASILKSVAPFVEVNDLFYHLVFRFSWWTRGLENNEWPELLPKIFEECLKVSSHFWLTPYQELDWIPWGPSLQLWKVIFWTLCLWSFKYPYLVMMGEKEMIVDN